MLSSRLDVSDGVQLRHHNRPTSPRAGRRGGEGEGRGRVKEGGMEEGGGEGRERVEEGRGERRVIGVWWWWRVREEGVWLVMEEREKV